MKKTLAAILALVILSSAALVACEKKNNNSNDGNDNTEDDIFVQGTTSTDSTDSSTDTGTDTGSSSASSEFEVVSKTVYVMSKVNLRNEPSTKSSTIVTSAPATTALTVIAQNDEWYKINYNGETMYVVRDYVANSPDEATFTDIASDDPLKTLTVVTNQDGTSPTVNLRTAPVFSEATKSSVVLDNTKVTADKPLEIIAKNGTGTWYKVKFENAEYYLAINSVTKPYFNETKGINDEPAGG